MAWLVALLNCRHASVFSQKFFTAILVLLLFAKIDYAQQDFLSLSKQASEALDSEQVDQALQLYEEALKLRPDWSEGLWYLGTLSYDRQHFVESAAALLRLVQIAPKDANAFAMLGLSEVKLNRSEAALTHLTEALKLGVGDEANLRQVVSFNQAVLLLNNGEFGRAQTILDQLAQQPHASNDDLAVALGRSILGISSPASPAEMQDAAMAAGKAEILAANRETEAAQAAYADLVKSYPKVHNVQFAYGRFLLNSHLDDQAVSAFKLEIANSPQHLLARLGIAGTLLLTDPATSVTYAQEATKLAPKLEEAHYLLGASLLATNWLEQAIDELENAERLKGNDPRVYFLLAKAYRRMNRESDAARARAKFAQFSPSQQ